jgi:hypothetical protein
VNLRCSDQLFLHKCYVQYPKKCVRGIQSVWNILRLHSVAAWAVNLLQVLRRGIPWPRTRCKDTTDSDVFDKPWVDLTVLKERLQEVSEKVGGRGIFNKLRPPLIKGVYKAQIVTILLGDFKRIDYSGNIR